MERERLIGAPCLSADLASFRAERRAKVAMVFGTGWIVGERRQAPAARILGRRTPANRDARALVTEPLTLDAFDEAVSALDVLVREQC